MTLRNLPRPLAAALLMSHATTLAAEGGAAAGLPLYAGEVFSSHAIEAVTVSGFGYGANPAGTRFGGFGIGFIDRTDALRLQAGFGGLIVGQEPSASARCPGIAVSSAGPAQEPPHCATTRSADGDPPFCATRQIDRLNHRVESLPRRKN